MFKLTWIIVNNNYNNKIFNILKIYNNNNNKNL